MKKKWLRALATAITVVSLTGTLYGCGAKKEDC